MKHLRPTLCFTELLLLAAIALGYLLSISMPIFGVPLQISVLKHFPMVVILLAIALHFTGMLLTRQALRVRQSMSECWPLTALALFAIAGSLVGKQISNVDDSFLSFGIYLLLLPVLAMTPGLPGDPIRWTRAIATLWAGASLAALAGAVARLPRLEFLHEIEYILSSAFVFLWFSSKNPASRTAAILLLFAAAGLNHKLTGYIVTLIALLYIGFDSSWRRVPIHWRKFFLTCLFIFVPLFVATLVASYFQFREYLPSGSAEVRINQYQQAWSKFLASPIWGTAYTEGSGESFREFNSIFNIPTHSDVLDILKHGGLIGIGLFIYGYFKIFRRVSLAALSQRHSIPLYAYFMAVRFFQIGALATFFLNPLLLKGPFALVIWGNLAIAIGIAIIVDPLPITEKPVRRKLRRSFG
jgi:O-antigen ligase